MQLQSADDICRAMVPWPHAWRFYLCFLWLTASVASRAFAQQPAPPPPTVIPPVVVQRVEATYPAQAFAEQREAEVELLVTVAADGSVQEVEVATSGGEQFDQAAVAAMRLWRFEPATRDGVAIAARIRVPFRFALPQVEPTANNAPATQVVTPEGTATPQPASDTGEQPIEVTVHGQRSARTEDRSASDFHIDREVLKAAPRQEGAEVLRAAPGVYIGRGEGPAVAHNYMLRGFDAQHGQDIEFVVGGLPINMPSHLHGQGYADLSFLISDVVRELHVSEGVYDPRQGDFAIAGSINVKLGVEETERGVRLRSSYGRFNTFRQLALWAPKHEAEETFGAAQFSQTRGFGENRTGQSGSGMFQQRFGDGHLSFRTLGIIHTARSNLAGVLRRNDINDNRVCFYCVYPYATAKAQNALANRILAGVFADYEGDEGENGTLGVFLGYDNFRLQENFTGFIQQSQALERTAGRGDLIEQQNRTLTLGLTGRYRTAPYRPMPQVHGTLEVGVDGRVDSIEQAQNLLDAAVRNQTWDRRVDAGVQGASLGVWGDLDWTLTQYVRARLGVRGTSLSYDINDRLGNFAPIVRPQDTYIVGFRRSAYGFAFGPRTSIEVKPLTWLSLLGAYGEGYRSPQARTLEDGERAPFTKVRSADLGVRVDAGDALTLTLSGYYTRLSDDVAFDASEGRLQRIGATRRLGAVAQATTRPASWMVSSLSFTLVNATLLQPPPATADNPQPPFVPGQNLPYVPPVVVRADNAIQRKLASSLAGMPLKGRAGLGFSYLSARPLPYGDFAVPFALLDASAALLWGPIELSLELFNALNAQYAAVAYSFASDWNPNDGIRPRTPAQHRSAGAPVSWMVSLGATL